MTPALAIAGLRSGYGSTEILQGFDLEVAEGEVVAVLGRNGVGKTTLAKSIMGLLPVRGGSVSVLGQDFTGRASHHVARRGVAYVAQEGGVFDELTVEENFRIVLARGVNLATAGERAFAAFPVLASRLDQKAGTLSGGERKMLMTARMLVQTPKLIVLDEVSEGVQPSNVREIAVVLREEQARGAAILIVEQKLDFALGLASRFTVLKRGTTVAAGEVGPETSAEVIRHLVL
jgi:ABC-type branched-subunit amino acid transport system ATPase component